VTPKILFPMRNFLILTSLFTSTISVYSVRDAALLDSGSSINIMSTTLYNSIPISCKSSVDTCNTGSIKLANDQTVQITGTATVRMHAQGGKYNILLYDD
jgi:predicted metal-dependent RNase